MTKFVDDDRGYLAWVEGHPGGYVVNCSRTPTPEYLKLHRASCKFIRSSKWSNWTTGQYVKVCSEDPDELRRWAAGEVGGDLQPCKSCSLPSGGPKVGNGPKPPSGGGVTGGNTEGGGGWGRFITAKNVVEFAAALIAVIGAVVGLIRWLL